MNVICEQGAVRRSVGEAGLLIFGEENIIGDGQPFFTTASHSTIFCNKALAQ